VRFHRDKKSWGLVGCAAVMFGLTLAIACSSAFEDDFDRNQMLSDLATTVIVPVYSEFEVSSRGLLTATQALCAAPTPTSLDTVQQAWRDARDPWKRSEAFGFGPVKELRIRSAVDWWPIDEAQLQAVLTDTPEITEQYVADQGSGARGFMALEYLLFDPEGGDEAVLTALNSGETAARRCSYVVAVADYLETKGLELANAWRTTGGNYAWELATAGQGSTVYTSSQAAINDLVNYLIFSVEEVADVRLGEPLGKASGGTPQPELVEGARSDNALEDISDTLLGVQSLYLGSHGGQQGVGLSDLVRSRKETIDERLRGELQDALAAIQAIPGPLEAAVTTDPAPVELAYERVKALQASLSADVAALLGVTLTFNDNDGD